MKKTFDLAAAVQDAVSTGRPETPTEPALRPQPRQVRTPKQPRVPTRQGARSITTWVDPEVYRMVKLIGLDTGQTTQDLMLEAIDMLFAAKGKGRMAKRG